ncbi:L-histidine N(alpha)-methyltransferase [Actinomadura sp. DC4]|uniref:L-histidine N(alpha)-methyltransferase n=1 Tax=Actinomadura sp. DC4 TaxID=3055069 RepID=UPI0025AF3B36|nr:L-histidine N(alpha)-methyltransferase [Actinomadura sp. DC4]MDN3356931.1 L-histidine N(alpha)-methyltransferase [Actinomadura sp. DC4]
MPIIKRFLTPDDLGKSLRQDVADGLTAFPKTLPPKWFYDERGSELFEEITRLEEYYPTRRERAILTERATEIASVTGARTLLELGAGSGEKTRLLLDALSGTLETYVPVDVSGDFLASAADQIAAEYPGLRVQAVVADYERHLDQLPAGPRRLIAFLGGTIGNMEPAERVSFLGGLRASMGEDDALLIGADLVKEPQRLVRAYDDARGVTAEFNRNVLRVINRELAADFDVSRFEHVAVWDRERERIEMRLRSAQAQTVRVGALDLVVEFAAGEEMRTEISAKFRRESFEASVSSAGLGIDQWWTDTDRDFVLSLVRPSL